MFKSETIFILGAGSSHPYGYPLGKELIQKIIENIDNDIIYLPGNNNFLNEYNFSSLKDILKNTSTNVFDNHLRLCSPHESQIFFANNNQSYIRKEIKELRGFNALKQALVDFDPISIDAFLRDHQSHAEAGKIMIIYSLLKCEDKEKIGISANEDNWYSYLINDIFSGYDAHKDLSSNKLNIISFNYDLSLEFCLYKKIQGTERFKQDEVANDFIQQLQEERITHVYGKLHTENVLNKYGEYFANESNKSPELNTQRFITALINEDEIKLIPEREALNKSHTDNIKNKLSKAKEIIIIGFGFDRDNLSVLGFPEKITGYKEFLKNCKTLKYMDYRGQMNSLHDQFEKIRTKYPNITITRSSSDSIINAYQNDFKIYLYQD